MKLFYVQHYWPLWLLCLLPAIVYWAQRSAAHLSAGRLWGALFARGLAVTLLVAALTEPVWQRASNAISVVYAVDVSSSVSPRFVQKALDWITAADLQHRPAHAKYVVFGREASLHATLEDARAVQVGVDEAVGSSDPVVHQDGTDLERALDMARLGFAPNHAKRLVLITDANATAGKHWRALAALQADKVRVYTVPATPAAQDDVWVESINVPEGIRKGETIEVTIRAVAMRAANAQAVLRLGKEVAGQKQVQLEAGLNTIAFSVPMNSQGAAVLSVRIEAEADQHAENNQLEHSVWIGPKPRVLYVEGAPQSASYLRDALVRQGIDVNVAAAGALDGVPLTGYDAVILSDVPSPSFNDAQQKRFESYVRDQGGGLIFAGGASSYGEAGFAKSTLEKVLPVKFEGEGKKKEMDLVLLIDRSFSMRGNKIEMAKSAALAALDVLDEQHRLAVVAFDSQPHEVVPLLKVGDKRNARDLISGIESSGQTNIFYALIYAYRLLEKSQAKAKHIILLSDGDTAPPSGAADAMVAKIATIPALEMARKWREQQKQSEEQAVLGDLKRPGGFEELVAQMVTAKMTLSTVTLGEEPNTELMTNLSRWGGGKNYFAWHAESLPQIYVEETKRVMRDAIVEEPFRPVIKQKSEATTGLDFARAPQLKGYVVSKSKQYAQVLLATEKDAPVLVRTQYGLGKSVAFLSDVKNRWAADWLNWPGYGKLWAQLVRETMRRESGEELTFRVERVGEEALIRVGALTPEGAYRNQLAPRVRMTDADGATAVLLLRQLGPGYYEARVPLIGRALHQFDLLESAEISAPAIARVGSRKLFVSYADELRSAPPDVATLREISERTGGKFAPTAVEIFADTGDRGLERKALWPYLAAAALLFFLIDVLVRRAPALRRAG